MVGIAIIEDDEKAAELLRGYLVRFYSEEYGGSDYKADFYKSGIDFLEKSKLSYDILFLDIVMPVLNGLDTARKIRKIGSTANIVFVTNMAQYALNGYEVDAIDYLVKPTAYFDFKRTMEKILKRTEITKNDVNIYIATKQDIAVIAASSIYYIEVQNHLLTFYTEKGIFLSRKALKDVEDRLESVSFARCNKCFLVNLKHVVKVQNNSVFVNNTELLMSRGRKKEFVEKLMNYTR